MLARHKWWMLLFLAFIVMLVIVLLSSSRSIPSASAEAVGIQFLGYTNHPSTTLRFALFSISNQAAYPIRWRGDWIEMEGSQSHQGRTVNLQIPECKYGPVLKAGQAFTLAAGDSAKSARWRLGMAFSRYTTQWRCYDFSFRHRLPLQLGPLVLVDAQRLLAPSNYVTTSSAWLAK
jgi:hypothetical protein